MICAGACYEESIYTDGIRTDDKSGMGNGQTDGMGSQNELTVEERIRIEFEEYGSEIRDWAVRVAFCESSYNPKVVNYSSLCYGLYQFKQSTWNMYGYGDIYSVDNQIAAVKNMINQLGFDRASLHWECK